MTRSAPLFAVCALVLCMGFAAAAHAATGPPLPSQGAQQGTATEFIIAPYFLLPSMGGSSTIRGVPVSVDVGPGEIFSNLEFGFMGYLEVRRGKWAVAFDTMYMDLEKEATFTSGIGTAGATLGVKQGMYELTAKYAAAEWLDLVAGVRINDISGRFAAMQLPLAGEASHLWADPIVGARMSVPDLGAWWLGVRVDIGGFGVGSTYAVQVYPTVGYDLARWVSLAAGFRYLKMKYETGAGTDLFVYDIATYGPVFGIVLRFD